MDYKNKIEFLNSDINTIKGIGEKKSKLFNRLGIYSVWDLLYYFPKKYDDRTEYRKISQLSEGMECCVDCFVSGSVIEKKIKNKMSLYILRGEDGTGTITIKWFSSPFNRGKLKRGKRYTFYGTITSAGNSCEMLLKEVEEHGQNQTTGKIFPVYGVTSGLSQNDVRKAIANTVACLDYIPETLPDAVLNQNKLLPLLDALKQIHSPADDGLYSKARYRFAFEELFILSLAMRHIRNINNIKTTVKISDVKCVSEFSKKLPFELTDDQKKCINEICSDIKKDIPMNRLIQGDVGSGKTAVAACAAYAVVKNGYQVAVMAPTEILANQHFKTFENFFGNTDIKVGLLTSFTKNKKDMYDQIASGFYDVVIGTHALLQNKVIFKELGLCITDEQHRFGVNQRAGLAGKGEPHILVMSATPIPRTLSLVVYGDLDISVISVLPSGRQKIDTFCVNNSMRARIDNFVEKQVTEGFQCYVVCPLIETSEAIDASAATDVYERMTKRFSDYNVAFLHGQMSPADKDNVMNDFKEKKYDILVTTSVIEVGIDVPNATLIIIENAERFGLSQLHQLRGRVGRGKNKSYCILVSECRTDDAKDRMKIMCNTSDGFEVAAEDMKLRGCGEFFGTRQHGVPELKVANLFTDMDIVEKASEACRLVMASDPSFETEEYKNLKERINKLFSQVDSYNIFN